MTRSRLRALMTQRRALRAGGPGCSSFDGFVYEHGPFTFASAPLEGGVGAAGGVRLTRNPYAWSSVANVVYLDSPAGVGLSYSATRADYSTNDTQTARDADAFLRALVARYPLLRLSERDLYIAGESYAGIYVPNLARTVLAGNAAGAQPALNLKGYAVGNGCTDAAFDGNALVPFAVGKSLISTELAATAAAACGGGTRYWNASSGSACGNALVEVDAALRGLNLYDTLEDCAGRGAADTLPLPTVGRAWPLRATLPPPGSPLSNWATLGVTVPCMDTSIAVAWLNAPDVRAALHAEPVATTGPFEMCSNAIKYTHDAGSMLPVHAALLSAGLRALIYSGDHDMCVPHTGTEAWTRSLGLPVDEAWRPWHAPPSQVAGYARTFKGGLTYATVKGAGHTVPTYKPLQALAMFSRFLDKKRL